jgi:hypothetical protein
MGAVRRWCSDTLTVEVLAGREDVDPAKGMQGEQILIAGEDEAGVAGKSECIEIRLALSATAE